MIAFAPPPPRRKKSRSLFAVLACLTLPLSSLFAETWTPVAAGTYDWNDASNWGGSTFPNATGGTATLTADFTGAQTINLNQAITVGSLTFNDTGASPDNAVTLASGTSGSLTLQVASGTATVTNTSSVMDVVSTNVTFASDTTINAGTTGTSNGLTLSGSLSGSGNITRTGSSSTLALTGDNSAFTGNWILSGGVSTSILSIVADNNLGAAPSSAATNITVTNNNEILFNGVFTLNANRNIQVNTGAGLILGTLNTSNTVTIAGIISGAGGLSRTTTAGNSVVILSGANTYTGSTTINSGILRAGSTGAFGANSAIIMGTGTGAKLDLNNFSNSIGSLSGGSASSGAVILGSATLTTGGDNTSTTYSGVISGTGGLLKTGTGVQTLSGANTYTGPTTVNSGTLALGAAGAIATASNLVLGGGTFASGGFNQTLGTLKLTSASSLDFGTGVSALVFADSHSVAWSGTLTLLDFDVGTDSLKVGSSGSSLTLSQLNSISLAGYSASLDSSGFVVFSAIPEPSSCALLSAFGAISLALLRRRTARLSS